LVCRNFQIEDSKFQNSRTFYPSIWLCKLMIDSNIHLSHFMIVTELYLILRNRCVCVTDEWVKHIAKSCTSVEFLRYIIIWEFIYNTLIFGNGWCTLRLGKYFIGLVMLQIYVLPVVYSRTWIFNFLFQEGAFKCPLHHLKVCTSVIARKLKKFHVMSPSLHCFIFSIAHFLFL